MSDETDIITQEEAEIEEMVLNAIQGEGTVELVVKLNEDTEKEREERLNFRWPSMNDEQAIERLTTIYCDGFPAESVSPSGYELARARATIEVLAEGPFGEGTWLPHGKDKVMFKGKKVYRPDTAEVKSRAILVAFLRRWTDLYFRFQELAL